MFTFVYYVINTKWVYVKNVLPGQTGITWAQPKSMREIAMKTKNEVERKVLGGGAEDERKVLGGGNKVELSTKLNNVKNKLTNKTLIF